MTFAGGAKWPPTREQSHFFDSTSPHHWHGFFAANRGKKTSESKKRSTGGKSVRIRNSMNAEFGIQILEPDHCFIDTVAAGVTKLWWISKQRLIQISRQHKTSNLESIHCFPIAKRPQERCTAARCAKPRFLTDMLPLRDGEIQPFSVKTRSSLYLCKKPIQQCVYIYISRFLYKTCLH